MSPEFYASLFWFFAGVSAFVGYLIVAELFARGWTRFRK